MAWLMRHWRSQSVSFLMICFTSSTSSAFPHLVASLRHWLWCCHWREEVAFFRFYSSLMRVNSLTSTSTHIMKTSWLRWLLWVAQRRFLVSDALPTGQQRFHFNIAQLSGEWSSICFFCLTNFLLVDLIKLLSPLFHSLWARCTSLGSMKHVKANKGCVFLHVKWRDNHVKMFAVKTMHAHHFAVEEAWDRKLSQRYLHSARSRPSNTKNGYVLHMLV